MSDIQIFKNENFGEVRVVEVNGEPMFCATDVCKALDIKNASRVVNEVVDDDLQQKYPIKDSLGRDQIATFVNEAGLYTIIFRSEKETAKSFRKWVITDVLPSIRKTGSYSIHYKLPETYLEALKALVVAEEDKERLRLDNEVKAEQIDVMSEEIVELKKKTEYVEKILACKGTVTVTQIAQDYGMSAKAFNKKLAGIGVQRKVNGQWILYAKYIANGYVQSKSVNITHTDGTPDVRMNTEWTQRGRLFLYETLKKIGVLPLIER